MFEIAKHLLINFRIWTKTQRISFWILKLNLFILSNNKIKPIALVIKTDAIGDYILIRNFFFLLKTDPFYKKFKWVLVVSSELQSFIEPYDKIFFDEIYYINKQSFIGDETYRNSIYGQISSMKPTMALNTLYSREKEISEALVLHSKAKFKVAPIGMSGNISIWEKKLVDLNYDFLIPNRDTVLFEFYRNKELFTGLGFEKLEGIKFEIKVKNNELNLDIKDYCVLSPFSRQDFKIIPLEITKKLIEKIALKYTNILLLCGPFEKEKENDLYRQIENIKTCNILKSEGKYTLEQVVKIINGCQILFTSDSMYLHIAAALNKKYIVFWKGDHYGRFLPYPNEIFNDYTLIMPEKIQDININQRYLTNRFTNNLSLEQINLKNLDLNF